MVLHFLALVMGVTDFGDNRQSQSRQCQILLDDNLTHRDIIGGTDFGAENCGG